MTGKLTVKQEKFALGVARGLSQAEAYRRAYNAKGMKPATVQKRASELMDNGVVAGRVVALRKPMAEKAFDIAALDKAWVLTRLAKVVDLGMKSAPILNDEGQPLTGADGEILTGETENLSAANKALELIGKEAGMFIDRKEVRTGPLDGMPVDEMKALLEAVNAIRRAREPA